MSLEVQDGNKPMPASDLVEAVLESTRCLSRCIEDGDWEGASREIEARNRLFQELSSALKDLSGTSQREKSQAERKRIKQVLENLQSENARFLKTLGCRLSSLRGKIKDIKKGRRALRLYKMPTRDQPRFFNRLG